MRAPGGPHAEKAGYKSFDPKASYEPGDKVYYVNREKSVIATTFGKSR